VKKVLLIILAIIVLFVAFVIEESIASRLAVQHIKRNNELMAILRDRIKENPPDTNALNSLILSVHSKDQFERTSAIAYLGQVDSHAEPAVDILIEALNSNDPYDAREAVSSLGEIGTNALRAIPALIKAVQQHPEEGSGFSAAKSPGQIAHFNDTEVAKVLALAAKSSDERMRFSANEGLQALESSRHEKYFTTKLTFLFTKKSAY
jgi:hypothetical protein